MYELVNTTEITSSVSSATITGINTSDVYLLVLRNIKPANNNVYLNMRLTASGSADSTTNYDRALEGMISSTSVSFWTRQSQNRNSIALEYAGTADSSSHSNVFFYCYNFQNTNEYSYLSCEMTNFDYNGDNVGSQGAYAFTKTDAMDGFNIFWSSGNITAGKMSLYKVL